MHNICIIPARGGSKRIERKNIKDFFGQPIITYSISVAIKSGLFDEVMVSTDDDEIASIAISCGASVPFLRSTKNSDDFATTANVIEEVLAQYQEVQQKKFNYVCCIYPTAPLININHLKQGYDLIINNNYPTVFPAVEFSYPVWRGLTLNEEGISNFAWPEYKNARSQDLQPIYHDAGQWYWIDVSEGCVLSLEGAGVVKLSEMECQDIDNLSDWKLAEMKYKLLNNA